MRKKSQILWNEITFSFSFLISNKKYQKSPLHIKYAAILRKINLEVGSLTPKRFWELEFLNWFAIYRLDKERLSINDKGEKALKWLS